MSNDETTRPRLVTYRDRLAQHMGWHDIQRVYIDGTYAGMIRQRISAGQWTVTPPYLTDGGQFVTTLALATRQDALRILAPTLIAEARAGRQPRQARKENTIMGVIASAPAGATYKAQFKGTDYSVVNDPAGDAKRPFLISGGAVDGQRVRSLNAAVKTITDRYSDTRTFFGIASDDTTVGPASIPPAPAKAEPKAAKPIPLAKPATAKVAKAKAEPKPKPASIAKARAAKEKEAATV